MPQKTAADFVAFLNELVRLKVSYRYAHWGNIVTEETIRRSARLFPKFWSDDRVKKAIARMNGVDRACDCSGALKWFIGLGPWRPGESLMKVNVTLKSAYDFSANMLREACSIKGNMSTFPKIPGAAVFFDGHVGYYVGGDTVVEAQGFDYGVVKTKLSARPWTHWGLPTKWIDYGDAAQKTAIITPAKLAQPLPHKNPMVFQLNDTVILNGSVFADSYGNGRGKTFIDHRGTITKVAPLNRTAPYHIGGIGWARPCDLKAEATNE